MFRQFNKPEYIFNPRQIPRRLQCLWREPLGECRVNLPWGESLDVNPQETIGRALVHTGVYDLSLTEMLWRVTDRDDYALDIGANIGYFSLLLSQRVGPQGRVFNFEPHPDIFKKMKHNISSCKNISPLNSALSEASGEMTLFIPVDFNKNEGLASLESSENSRQVIIQAEALDDLFARENKKIDVIKIDVEGHELSVFKGGRKTLAKTQFVLFEDFLAEKSLAIQFLKEQGFFVQRIVKQLLGPQLVPVEQAKRVPLWEPPNYIAYRDEKDLALRMKPFGWKCLRS